MTHIPHIPSARPGEPKKRARASRRGAALGDGVRGVAARRARARTRYGHRVRKRLLHQRRAQLCFYRRHAERAARGLDRANGVSHERLDQKRARQRVEREPGRRLVTTFFDARGGLAAAATHKSLKFRVLYTFKRPNFPHKSLKFVELYTFKFSMVCCFSMVLSENFREYRYNLNRDRARSYELRRDSISARPISPRFYT